jgi:4-amino-4-deoxy-L-arabinose transferase-like glycosyltransferase
MRPADPAPKNLLRDLILVLGLLSLAAILFFFHLGATGLFDADEPAYAEAAREMLAQNDWVTPTFNGQLRPDKPILFYWLLLGSYRVFGVTSLAVRCWSALAGVGLTLLTFWAARRWLGRRADHWAALVLLTAPLTAILGRAGVTDMMLSLWVSATVFAGLAALDGEAHSRRKWVAVTWTAAALAVLMKGPVGFLIPALALGGGLLLRGEFKERVRCLLRWDGVLIFLALAGPWYALIWARSGSDFVQGFIFKHNISRFTGVVSGHSGPLWFYLPVLLVGFFPWTAYLPIALRDAARAIWRHGEFPAEERLCATCLAWSLGVLVFFSLAGTKLPSYLFPAFPALALLAGRSIAAVNRTQVPELPPRWVAGLGQALLLGVGLPLAAALCVVPFIFDRLRPIARGVLDGVPPPTEIAMGVGLLVAIGTLAASCTMRWRPRVLSAMMVVFILTAAAAAPRAYAILQAPLRAYAEAAARLLGPDDPVLMYGLNAPTVVFYSARRMLSFGRDDRSGLADTVGRLQSARRPVVVITRAEFAGRLNGLPGLKLAGTRGGYALFTSE